MFISWSDKYGVVPGKHILFLGVENAENRRRRTEKQQISADTQFHKNWQF